MKKITLIIACILLMVGTSFSSEVCLQWNANSEADLAGYRIFVREAGQSYNYYDPAWEGTATDCCVIVDQSKIYYFVARAFDTEDFESDDSNEVSANTTPEYVGVGPSAPTGLGVTRVTP